MTSKCKCHDKSISKQFISNLLPIIVRRTEKNLPVFTERFGSTQITSKNRADGLQTCDNWVGSVFRALWVTLDIELRYIGV